MSEIDRIGRTDIAWSDASSITVFGKDLPSEIIGKLNLGDMGFLELTGRIPTPNESIMFNAMLVTLVEHGLTPSAIVARMTYLGAPESLQGAVAAGLNGLGTVFVGSIEGVAKLLYEVMPDTSKHGDLDAMAYSVASSFKDKKALVPGIGHPLHKPVDPRAPRLLAIARETGFDGPYLTLIAKISKASEVHYGRSLPVNATGVIGALCCQMRFDWRVCRGLGVMARAVGLVGHILEEIRNPIAAKTWRAVESETTKHFFEGED